MAATEVTLKTVSYNPNNMYSCGGYLTYTYERKESIVEYYVKFSYYVGNGYPGANPTGTATIDDITKSGTVHLGSSSHTPYDILLGPWEVEISSPTDATLPDCTAVDDHVFWNNTFDAVVPAGGDIPVYANVSGAVKKCRKAYANAGGTVRECTVWTNVNGTIRKIG